MSLGVEVCTNTKVTKLTAIDSSSTGSAYADAAYGAEERCTVHTEPMTASTSGSGGEQQTVADLVLWTAGSSPTSKGAKVSSACYAFHRLWLLIVACWGGDAPVVCSHILEHASVAVSVVAGCHISVVLLSPKQQHHLAVNLLNPYVDPMSVSFSMPCSPCRSPREPKAL